VGEILKLMFSLPARAVLLALKVLLVVVIAVTAFLAPGLIMVASITGMVIVWDRVRHWSILPRRLVRLLISIAWVAFVWLEWFLTALAIAAVVVTLTPVEAVMAAVIFLIASTVVCATIFFVIRSSRRS